MAKAKSGYMDHFLTPAESFFEVTRGRPYQLGPEARRRAGLTPETWRLEIVPEEPPSNPTLARSATATARPWPSRTSRRCSASAR